MKSHKPKAVSSKPPRAQCRFSGAYGLKLTAFTLLEVVVAIGIFAIGMVAVIGLFSPVAKSVGDLADAEAATHVAELLSAQLQAQEVVALANSSPFSSLVARLKVTTGKTHQLTDADAKTDYDIAADPQLLFASHDGTKIGAYGDAAVWGIDSGTRKISDRDKFFEIALIRNETLSPNDPTADAAAPLLGYTARLRWPAFIALAGGTGSIEVGSNPTAPVKFDYSQKRVLFFAGSVTR